jgi:hypothetical protein
MVVQRSLLGVANVGPLSKECCLMDLLHQGTISGKTNLDCLLYTLVALNQYATTIGDCLLAMWRAEKLRVSICMSLRILA